MDSHLRRPVLRAGRLSFEVGEHEWSWAIVDAEQGIILTGPSVAGRSGSFGFQTADSGRRVWQGGPLRDRPGSHNETPPPTGSWWHAVALLDARGDGSGFLATLATDDPAGRTIAILVRPDGEHVLSVEAAVRGAVADVVATGQYFATSDHERFLGFGERSDASVRSQGVVEHYVGEGPWQEHEYHFVAKVAPPWALRQRRDASYFPVPWVLSTEGHGVLVGNDELSYVRLRSEHPAVWSVEVEAPTLRYRVFAGPRPLDALRRFTEATGRQPPPGDRWWFGPWYQTGHANHVPTDEEQRQLDALRAARAPVSAAETHCRFLPLGAHRGSEDAESERTARFHAEGLATLSYLNPMVGAEYHELWEAALESGALQRRPDQSVCSFKGYVGDRVPPVTTEAQLDFTTEAGRRLFGQVAAQLVALGHDGWMEDFGEYGPLDAVSAGGTTGTAGHNAYPRVYHRVAGRVADELEGAPGRSTTTSTRAPLARFARSGWTGTAAHVPMVWGGDPTCGWGFDGLASAVTQALSIGCSGVAMWGSDTGGFVSSRERLTVELLCRWIEFSACCPVMRTKSSGLELPAHRRPQIWDPEVVGVWARWAAWHTQLNDYLLAAHAEYRVSGRPIMTALPLLWPDEKEALECEDEFLLGPDLLVAPVIEPGSTSRSVWLPPGRWVALWQVARYQHSDRGVVLTGGPHGDGEPWGVHEGRRRVEVGAPLEEVPLFVGAGSVVGLLSSEVDTLYEAATPPAAAVPASARQDERRLLAFPCGRRRSMLAPGEAVVSEVGAAGWRLRLEAGPARRYQLFADLRLVEGGAFRPSDVTVDGVSRSDWSYDDEHGVLALSFVGGPVVVEVTR